MSLQHIPKEKSSREQIRSFVRQYVFEKKIIPPILLEELQEHTSILLESHSILPSYQHYTMILLNNEVWQKYIVGIPYQQRILLLPQCLRERSICPAQIDELGLLCENCGKCDLGNLTQIAEEMGYATLIAEGSTVVAKLLQDGKLRAVIGVGCLEGLERAFPHWSKQGIPGIAIPLYSCGCNATKVDVDWVMEAIQIPYQHEKKQYSIHELQQIISGWFHYKSIPNILQDPTSLLSYQWLTKDGKRWRPLLLVASYIFLMEDTSEKADWENLQKLALSVECFHKASLIHDDIEDHDQNRYGEPTLHQQYGVELAINAGDFLVGEGYRWIRSCRLSSDTMLAMLHLAIEGHCQLCMGQGQELHWRTAPPQQGTVEISQILQMFAQKTVPGFSVAIGLGALLANASPEILAILQKFSYHLGVAYQIQDDIHDFSAKKQHFFMETVSYPPEFSLLDISGIEMAKHLLEEQSRSAVHCLKSLPCMNLKVFLQNVLAKVLG